MAPWIVVSILAATLLGGVLPGTIKAQVSGQAFEITSESAHATVGDSVTLRFRVRLDERDLLFDTIPAVVGELPPGVRVLSVEKLQRTPDRIFHGRATLAFYRPGRRPIPTFGLPFMRAVKGVQRATLTSDSAYIDIVPLLPPGSPPLKDIRELDTSPRLPLVPLGALTLVAFAAAGYRWIRSRRRVRIEPTSLEDLVPMPQATAYDAALESLIRIERECWPMRNQVTRHYEAIVEVVRDYLEAAEEIPAHERTTGELIWSLPPHLSDEALREQLRDLLTESDLVKFARLRPTSSAAADFLGRARTILDVWHQAQTSSPIADAVR